MNKTHRFRKWLSKKTDSQNLGDLPGQVAEEDIGEEDDYVAADIHYRQSNVFPSISTKSISVFVGTWNVAGRYPVGSLAVDLDEWLNIKECADIYVLGFQEIVPLKAQTVIRVEDQTESQKWNLLIGQTLNGKNCFSTIKPMDTESYQYTRVTECKQSISTSETSSKQNTQYEDPDLSSRYMLIESKKMVGVFISVWMKKRIVKSYHVSVKVSSVACGIMGYLGNKGSVSVSISIEGTSFCFTNAHLASGEKKGDEGRRNQQVSEIFRRTTFNRRADNVDEHHPLTILGHDRIFWFGDLNYRLYSKDYLTRQLIKEQDWVALQEYDQLQQELKEGGVFEDWKEGDIQFAPMVLKIITTLCDRILWYGKGVKQLSYIRSESKFSDHRPVSATFSTYIVLKSANPRLIYVPSKVSTM